MFSRNRVCTEFTTERQGQPGVHSLQIGALVPFERSFLQSSHPANRCTGATHCLDCIAWRLNNPSPFSHRHHGNANGQRNNDFEFEVTLGDEMKKILVVAAVAAAFPLSAM